MADPSACAHTLIEAALPMFALGGLEGTSTREIARAANKPMSAITYCFGGKDALYIACAKYIDERLEMLVDPTLDKSISVSNPLEAEVHFNTLFRTVVRIILCNETAEFSRFIAREQQEPTDAFDIFYKGIVGKIIGRMVELLTIVAGGLAKDTEIRISIIALIGQVLSLRIARAATLRLTNWTAIEVEEAAMIESVVCAHAAAMVGAIRRGDSGTRGTVHG